MHIKLAKNVYEFLPFQIIFLLHAYSFPFDIQRIETKYYINFFRNMYYITICNTLLKLFTSVKEHRNNIQYNPTFWNWHWQWTKHITWESLTSSERYFPSGNTRALEECPQRSFRLQCSPKRDISEIVYCYSVEYYLLSRFW